MRLTPPGLAVADEDDPLAPEPANLAGVLTGYARVSTSGQNLDRQARALTEAGCTRIFAGKQPGKTAGLSRARRAPDAQVRADLGGHAGGRCRRRPRSHATSDARFSGWYGGRPRHSLICCWMTSGAGRASTVKTYSLRRKIARTGLVWS